MVKRGLGELTTKVQYRITGAFRILSDMKMSRSGKHPARVNRLSRLEPERLNFRSVAAHHAIGGEKDLTPEKKRLLNLAVTEAEALACQTGVPELVLLSLAEEKVRATRKWLARQEQLKARSAQWQLAA